MNFLGETSINKNNIKLGQLLAKQYTLVKHQKNPKVIAGYRKTECLGLSKIIFGYGWLINFCMMYEINDQEITMDMSDADITRECVTTDEKVILF